MSKEDGLHRKRFKYRTVHETETETLTCTQSLIDLILMNTNGSIIYRALSSGQTDPVKIGQPSVSETGEKCFAV